MCRETKWADNLRREDRQGEYRPARLHWRDDFLPPAPLFAVDALGLELATNELVERVRRAGLSGVAFVDAADGAS